MHSRHMPPWTSRTTRSERSLPILRGSRNRVQYRPWHGRSIILGRPCLVTRPIKQRHYYSLKDWFSHAIGGCESTASNRQELVGSLAERCHDGDSQRANHNHECHLQQ
jgi:hypothetical protein